MSWRWNAVAEGFHRVRADGAGVLPRRGRGLGIALRFFLRGGRRLVLRVPLAETGPGGMRTVAVQVTLQPDGDVLVALPRDAVDRGLFDARSARRLSARLRELAERVQGGGTPLWGLDATQLLGEAMGMAGALVGGLRLLSGDAAAGPAGWSLETAAQGGWALAMLAFPIVAAKLRPWLMRTVVPRALPVAMWVGERIARV